MCDYLPSVTKYENRPSTIVFIVKSISVSLTSDRLISTKNPKHGSECYDWYQYT